MAADFAVGESEAGDSSIRVATRGIIMATRDASGNFSSREHDMKAAKRSVRRIEVSRTTGTDPIEQVVDLLGGQKMLGRRISSKLDVHEAIASGIPGGALVHMVSHVHTMKHDDVSRAVGVSLRTVQRRTKAPRLRLSQEQSGRTWKFAEILAKATEVFGTQTEAERWLASPAMALDERRPADLLSSPAGVEMVEQLLGRLEHGVYT
jgi:putative toxin-antitoxin system antitoxin component (TIGR02293 family)